MSEKEKENTNIEPIKDDELDSVSGGKGFSVNKGTVVDGNDNFKNNRSSFI